MGFKHHAKIQKKLMTQFQENVRTDQRTEGRRETRIDRLYFVRPLQLLPGVEKEHVVINSSLKYLIKLGREISADNFLWNVWHLS